MIQIRCNGIFHSIYWSILNKIFITPNLNREAEYVRIDSVLPVKQVDQYSITDDSIKSTIRDSNESTFKVDSYDPSFWAKYYSNSKKLVIQINISMSWNNNRKVIGKQILYVWTNPYSLITLDMEFSTAQLQLLSVRCVYSFFSLNFITFESQLVLQMIYL